MNRALKNWYACSYCEVPENVPEGPYVRFVYDRDTGRILQKNYNDLHCNCPRWVRFKRAFPRIIRALYPFFFASVMVYCAIVNNPLAWVLAGLHLINWFD